MTSAFTFDLFLLGVVPYIALALFFIGSIARYRNRAARFAYSSLSSQFLENRQHFWAMVPFHYGILVVLAGHLAAFAMPGAILGWNASAIRLYALEGTGLAFGFLAALGLAAAILRRA